MFQYLDIKLIAQGTNKIHFTMHKYICIIAYKGIICTRQEIRCQGANNQKKKKRKKNFVQSADENPPLIVSDRFSGKTLTNWVASVFFFDRITLEVDLLYRRGPQRIF